MTEAASRPLQVLRDAPPVRARQGRYELRFARTQEELPLEGAARLIADRVGKRAEIASTNEGRSAR